MPQLGEVDMVIADPPYGISIVSGDSVGGSKAFGSSDVRGSDGASNLIEVNTYAPIIGDDSIDTAVQSFECAHKLFPKAVHIWWGGNYYANHLPPSSCWYVWDKDNTGNFADAELAWCSNKTAVRLYKHTWNGLIKESERGQKRVHPTQKPIQLMKWLMQQNDQCEVILDPFMGSAPTLVAAKELGKKAIGIELSEAYCEIAAKRLAQEVLQFPEYEQAA